MRMGWSWWHLAICVQRIKGVHRYELHEETGDTFEHEWWFTSKWETVPLEDWQEYFIHDQTLWAM